MTKQYAREVGKRDELLELIRNDLRMRGRDGVVDISNFIWERINEILDEA